MTNDFDLVAAALPAYDIGGEIGRGAWGVVLAGRHRQLERHVAIKQLPASFAADPTVRARFTAEARLLASLDHPHVVPVYDFVQRDELCVLVMEMLPGGTVWSRFTSTGFSAPSAVAVALACAAGLKAAHDQGILHRDIKPENLMFGARGALKVTDFGIAKMVGGGETLSTRAGEVIGTPAYMAPEQARGGVLSPATDIYALSTMLYELLAGVLPFPDDADAMALLFRHAFETPVPLEQVAPAVPAAVVSVVMRGLATEPSERFVSAEDFALALASAGRTQWGPDWLLAANVPVLGANKVTSAATAAAPATVRAAPAGTVPGAPRTAPMPAPPGSNPPPPGSIPPPPGTIPRAETMVRPVAPVRAPGVALSNVAAADLVPVQNLVPPRAVVPGAVAALLALAAVLVALLGLSGPSRGGTLPARRVLVDGHSAAVGARASIDLTKPIAVRVTDAPRADHVQLSLYVLGVSARSASAPARRVGTTVTATLPALGGQYIFGGTFTARVTLLRQGRSVGTRQLGLRTTQPAPASALAVLDALLLLFSLAYVESFLRTLRRSRVRSSAVVGAPAAAAVVAVGVIGAAWILLGREPTVPTGVASIVLAVAAGIAAVVAARRIGRRRRRRTRPRT